MGDHSNEALQLQKRRDDEEYARHHLLGGECLGLDGDSIPWILNHIDCFVCQSRGNVSVAAVFLQPHAVSFDGYDDDVWQKLGQAIGNLQALERLLFYSTLYSTL
jgi:hypothetical protein